jgi:hypothetical protein
MLGPPPPVPAPPTSTLPSGRCEAPELPPKSMVSVASTVEAAEVPASPVPLAAPLAAALAVAPGVVSSAWVRRVIRSSCVCSRSASASCSASAACRRSTSASPPPARARATA